MKKYTQTHEWVEADNGFATIGISDFAQKELGEIVSVELPHVGAKLESGQEAVVLESSKAAADVYTPVSGEVIEINDAVKERPELINQFPESDGWLFKVKLLTPSELAEFMDYDLYLEYIKT